MGPPCRFPVLTREIGDSWIHGTASDPEKLARFRALSRLYDGWAESLTPERLAFGRDLAMVAEHTWGVDIKTYLRDETAWDRDDFEAARRNDYRFAYAEQSWTEQRHYLSQAVDHLAPVDRAAAEAALTELAPGTPSELVTGTTLRHGDWIADLDMQSGDIIKITAPDGRALEGQDGSLFGYRHESYDWHELQKHLDSYLQHREEWAILDHDKPGLANATTARTAAFWPGHLGISPEGNAALGQLSDEAHMQLGAPRRTTIVMRGLDARRVQLTLMLHDKPANRMPEAGFANFTPAGSEDWALRKMGLWHEGQNIVRRGGGQLQAVEAVRAGSVTVTPIDSALVASAGSPFIPFQPEVPDYAAGIRFNLYNNKWGTNFPMWWEGSIAFRFVVDLGA